MRVIWTEEAEVSFNQNISYLEEEWNESVIENFLDKTDEVIMTISKHPLAYPLVDSKEGIHKCLVVRQVSLYYVVLEDRIDLITFWNNYQDPKRLKL